MSKILFWLYCTRSSQDFEVAVQAIFWSWNNSTEAEVWSVFSYWGLIEVIKFNLGRDSEAGCGWDSDVDAWSRFWRWNLNKILLSTVGGRKLISRTGPSGLFCLWQCLSSSFLFVSTLLRKSSQICFLKCIYIKSNYIWIYRNCICWVDNELPGKRKNLSSLERELTSSTLVPRSEGKLLQVNFLKIFHLWWSTHSL